MQQETKAGLTVRYDISLEIKEVGGVKFENHSVILDAGKTPSVGDILNIVKDNYNVTCALKDFVPYIVLKPEKDSFPIFRVMRVTQDLTYRPVTRI